ncbi:hypothetical protein IFR05_006041 [Cadophora sp. M221]|nr:hypothetical protein IFR05_006041 [Cadophora sp. M221]
MGLQYIGLSVGSVTGNDLNVKYPHDVDATILTGFSSSLPLNSPLINLLSPANVEDPKRFGSLSTGYLVVSSEAMAISSFYSPRAFDSALAYLNFETRDITTAAEIVTIGYSVARAPNYTAPLFVITGEFDELYCNPGAASNQTANCQHQVTVGDKFYSDQPQEAVPPQYYYGSSEGDKRRERTICGLRAATFFLSLALLLVILAAAIGGGVGGTMAVNNAKSANSNNNGTTFTSTIINTVTTTVTPTSSDASAGSSTSSSILSVPTSGILALDCPNIDDTELRMTLIETSVFTVICGRDYPGQKNDILAVTAYSLADCARACASYNLNAGSKLCKGAAFKTDLSYNVNVNYGNCWLKNNTNSPNSGTSNGLASLLLNN